MDTRTKIVSLETARNRAAETRCTVYRAGFDVLTAARLRRIREIAKPGVPLIAVVTDVPNSLLPTQARAELAASLAVINFVVIGAFPVHNVIDDSEADTRRTAELIQYIQRRNGAHE